ncbi:tRNA methyltransferase 10 homolog A-like isoform X4 [Ostrea edulis]|uniref:tRNA methyltransferase 10 homolog A-like isoform X3 n=1 Tax=Ostrea edulis TaxID=37623 RepID=UPI0020945634|nr:tRNA methyltransferase 10 homolog A-like isoform X3 [Ostrea edulis]XP_056017662.1 tRNA methyltransferase 10 homolog A-like isoform X4 [Ostrea edulis]
MWDTSITLTFEDSADYEIGRRLSHYYEVNRAWVSLQVAKEKQRKKQKRREAIERGDIMAPTRKKLRSNTMAKSSCKTSVVIDCSLDEYMGDKDIMKLVKQIQFCYSSNRRSQNPMQFYVTGVHGQTKDRLEAIGDYQNWDVNFTNKDYHEVFEKKNIIYLSSESDNILEELEPDKAYIIGGLVDHNHHKGLCHSLATERDVGHARLPISEFLDMKTRKVLTINHVFDILLKYTETKDWPQSFCSVLPQRKGAQVKQDSQTDINRSPPMEKEDCCSSVEQDTRPQASPVSCTTDNSDNASDRKMNDPLPEDIVLDQSENTDQEADFET